MAAIAVPSQNCLLVIDQNFQDRQTGSITPQQSLQAWLLAIPQGGSAASAAEAFAAQQNLPMGAIALLLDFTTSPPTYSSHQLTDAWAND